MHSAIICLHLNWPRPLFFPVAVHAKWVLIFHAILHLHWNCDEFIKNRSCIGFIAVRLWRAEREKSHLSIVLCLSRCECCLRWDFPCKEDRIFLSLSVLFFISRTYHTTPSLWFAYTSSRQKLPCKLSDCLASHFLFRWEIGALRLGLPTHPFLPAFFSILFQIRPLSPLARVVLLFHVDCPSSAGCGSKLRVPKL